MIRTLAVALLAVATVVAAPEPKKPAKDYQKVADETEWTFTDFNFKETLATEFKGYDVKSEVVADSKTAPVVHISKDKKDLLAWQTHFSAPFAQRNGILYYAKFGLALQRSFR